MHSKGFRTSDAQRNVMGQSTEMSPFVSMLFQTFLNPLKFLMGEIFNILVSLVLWCTVLWSVPGHC